MPAPEFRCLQSRLSSVNRRYRDGITKAEPLVPSWLPAADKEQIPAPEMSNADLVALRVRVIALENLLISLLATASDQQLELAREMADLYLAEAGLYPSSADHTCRSPHDRPH